MNPKGHAALVTGGASGLGEGTAMKLAAAGCKVTILDMNMDLAREVAAKIGGHCRALRRVGRSLDGRRAQGRDATSTASRASS